MSRTPHMALSPLGSLALLAGILTPIGPNGGQQQPGSVRPSFSGTVDLSTISVTVTGPDGLPVTGLGAADFELLVDGEPQSISFVLSPEDAPLEIAVLIDSSQSIRRNAPNLKPDLKRFLNALASEDCVLVLPFADFVGPGFWNVDIESFVDGLVFDGTTKLNDAVLAALNTLSPLTRGDLDPPPLSSRGCAVAEPGSRRRRAVVLITDGHDQGSYASDGEVLSRAWWARVPFVVLGVGEAAADQRADPRQRGYVAQLDALVRAAGGRFVQSRRDVASEDLFDEILATLQATYVLATQIAVSQAAVVPEWHPIEVRVRDRDLGVVAPQGLYLSAAQRTVAGELTHDAQGELAVGHALAALDISGRAIRADNEFWQPHFVHALVTLEAGELEAASTSARRAAYLSPLSAEAHALLAETMLQQGNLEQAARSAINAGYLGRDISAAVVGLQQRGITLDIEALPNVPRMWVMTLDHTDLPLQQQSERVARLLMHHVSSDPGLRLVDRPRNQGDTFGLRVELAEVLADGGLEGRLTISWAVGISTQRRTMTRSAPFKMSGEEAAALIGADPPPMPPSLAAAFTTVWRRGPRP